VGWSPYGQSQGVTKMEDDADDLNLAAWHRRQSWGLGSRPPDFGLGSWGRKGVVGISRVGGGSLNIIFKCYYVIVHSK